MALDGAHEGAVATLRATLRQDRMALLVDEHLAPALSVVRIELKVEDIHGLFFGPRPGALFLPLAFEFVAMLLLQPVEGRQVARASVVGLFVATVADRDRSVLLNAVSLVVGSFSPALVPASPRRAARSRRALSL